jgi:hypothetical protein
MDYERNNVRMIYKLIHNIDIFESNPGLRAVEEFQKLTDKQMKFTILVVDPSYDNPVRTLQGKDKREKAALLAGYLREKDGKRLDKNARSVVAGEVLSIEKAIEKMKELVFDEKTDTLITTKELIEKNKSFIRDLDPKSETYGKDLALANKFQKELPELIEAALKIESLLNVSLNQKPEFDPKESVGIEIVNSVGEETEGEQTLATIDRVMMEMQKNKE